jgi:hypothetical protein
MRPRLRLLVALGGAALVLAACGGGATISHATFAPSTGSASARAVPSGDWPQFDYTAQRSGVGPASTGITPSDLRRLTRRVVHVDGTVDSSPIELHGVSVKGRRRDVLFVTTTYGRTIALDADTGANLWEYVPPGIGGWEGSARITTATPTADPTRRYLYTTSPDGRVHKLAVATGHELRSGHWPVRVTFDPTHEKLASPPSILGSSLIVVTDGYLGDAPVYQGHVVKIDRASGHISAVWNALCSENRHLINPPNRCPESDAAIWGRAGAVIEPGSGRVLVTTSNGRFDGRRYWGDSTIELSPKLALLHNWTPRNQAILDHNDVDLGSTSPALLPPIGGRRLLLQGGKAGILSLLDLDRLDGTAGPAGSRTGGELQDIGAPGGAEVFTAPAVWQHGGRDYVFVATGAGTAAYVMGASHRLSVLWHDGTPGTSPVLAGGLLYVFDPIHGGLVIRRPLAEPPLAELPAGTGHWNSPIAVGGRIALPVGNGNDHATRGTVYIWHLPGR